MTDAAEHWHQILAWHFHPETGSPYWLERARTLGFDPIREIKSLADLHRFPAVADDWRTVPTASLIPKGCGGAFSVWETGGTTGPPRRIVDQQERTQGIQRVNALLDRHGFPEAGSGDWLHIGPSGPHLVGTNVRRLARMREALCHTIDLDPRWVRLLYRENRTDEVKRYRTHLVQQALAILRTQPVAVLTITPPLLQALCEHPEAYDLVQAKVRGIIWFGTSLSEEALRFLEEELLPSARFVGWYGNTLMGIACQRPRQSDDAYRCIFRPPTPGAVVRLVSPGACGKEVGFDQRGQVCIHVLTRELFLPWHLERDQAIRVRPSAEGDPDGVAQVAPLDQGGSTIEGVY